MLGGWSAARGSCMAPRARRSALLLGEQCVFLSGVCARACRFADAGARSRNDCSKSAVFCYGLPRSAVAHWLRFAEAQAEYPTREESCLQPSHRSRALLLRPSQRQRWEKKPFAAHQKTHRGHQPPRPTLLISPSSKVRNRPTRARASLLFWNTRLQARALNRGRRLFLGRTKIAKIL